MPHLQGELNAILAFVEQLNEVDVDGVEPMTSVTPMAMKKRQDGVTDGGYADKIVAQRAGDRGPFLPGAEGGRVNAQPGRAPRESADRVDQISCDHDDRGSAASHRPG